MNQIKNIPKLIKSKMYNVSTAILMGRVSQGTGDNKFKETLYQTPGGDYFLHGRGGDLTRWEGKEDLIAITPLTAKNWSKKHGRT